MQETTANRWVREGLFRFTFELRKLSYPSLSWYEHTRIHPRSLSKQELFNMKEAHNHSFSYKASVASSFSIQKAQLRYRPQTGDGTSAFFRPAPYQCAKCLVGHNSHVETLYTINVTVSRWVDEFYLSDRSAEVSHPDRRRIRHCMHYYFDSHDSQATASNSKNNCAERPAWFSWISFRRSTLLRCWVRLTSARYGFEECQKNICCQEATRPCWLFCDKYLPPTISSISGENLPHCFSVQLWFCWSITRWYSPHYRKHRFTVRN